jgi:hypothetical protein
MRDEQAGRLLYAYCRDVAAAPLSCRFGGATFMAFERLLAVSALHHDVSAVGLNDVVPAALCLAAQVWWGDLHGV